MAGYWPSAFLRFYGPRRSRGPKNAKNETRPRSSHLDRTSLVNKGFIIWPKCYISQSISFRAPMNVSTRDFQNQP